MVTVENDNQPRLYTSHQNAIPDMYAIKGFLKSVPPKRVQSSTSRHIFNRINTIQNILCKLEDVKDKFFHLYSIWFVWLN